MASCRRAKTTTSDTAQIWFHAVDNRGQEPPAEYFYPYEPSEIERKACRFNFFGQFGYYVAEHKETAAMEVQGARTVGSSVWIAGVRFRVPMTVLDLRIGLPGRSRISLPVLLHGLVYSGELSQSNEDDRSRPEYRVTQYIADLVRYRGLHGILYTRTRDSGFPNPEAWGTNLVIVASKPALASEIVEQPRLFCWAEDHSHLGSFPQALLTPASPVGP